MPAYVVAEARVTDPEKYEVYKSLAPAAITKFGGRYIARGGQCDTLEGEWRPSRLVIVEFPSYAEAKAWYDCPEYRKAREARAGAAVMKMVLVEGL